MKLTDTKIKTAKPKSKAYGLFDGGGLYLEVRPNGGKWWRYKFRFSGRPRLMSLGTYPDVSLRLARERHGEARKQVAEGIDPGEARKAEKAARAGEDSFESIGREWWRTTQGSRTAEYGKQILRRLEADVFPWLGKKPVAEIKAPEVLKVLRRIESRGAVEKAHRLKMLCGQIFRYAVATGRAERDPTGDLRGALATRRTKHMATIIDPQKVGELLRAIDGFEGTFEVWCALKLAPLVFVRPGELRKAEWPEVDLEKAEWRIPAHRMKVKETHIVPLSRQAVEILRELEPLTGIPLKGRPDAPRYVFPGQRSRLRPMSNNAVNAALRRLGYAKEEITGHGFRSMASTLLREKGWPSHLIERQLAHAERNKVAAAYNYAEYLPDRKKMMQDWADHLDTLRQTKKVVPLFKEG